jgi:lysophospholipase L1-like esterase
MAGRMTEWQKRTFLAFASVYDYFALDSLHFNPTGRRFVAEALLKRLLAQLASKQGAERNR